MNLAEELQNKRDERAAKLAVEVANKIKPLLHESASEGYTAYSIKITGEEKDKNLHVYANPKFIENLNLQLDGVKARFEDKFIESILGNGFGTHQYRIVFNW
jgi:hypothetical protein